MTLNEIMQKKKEGEEEEEERKNYAQEMREIEINIMFHPYVKTILRPKVI